MSLSDYITTDFGHVKLNFAHIKCERCGMEMSTRHPAALQTHIMQVIGFVGMHKDCVPGEPHSIFGLGYGAKK